MNWKTSRLLLLLPTLFLAPAILVAATDPSDASEGRPRAGASRVRMEQDSDTPPALAGSDRAAPFLDLASRLSLDRSWLRSDVVKSLHERGLWLNEVFAGAPTVLTLDGVAYRVVLEKYGAAWADFDPSADPFLVYLTHEIDSSLGGDRVVGFQEGAQSIFFAHDLDAIAAIGVSLAGLSPDEARPLGDKPKAANADQPGVSIPLGALRKAVLPRQVPLPPPLGSKAVCPRQVKPSSCSSGKPVCDTAGYTPFYVMSAIKIKEDHETLGSPEIDLFPVRLDINSASGGSTNAQTGMIFSGRTIVDFAGQSVYLPDVNDKNVWYSLGQGMALFPTNNGVEFGATLVDDDSEAGKLKIDSSKINTTKVLLWGGSVVQAYRQKKIDEFFLFTALLNLLDLLGITSNDDDLYVESLGVNNNLFCDFAIGQGFPYTFTQVATEWEMKGHFACINPSCTPPPPPPPSCGSPGAACAGDEECCSFSCDTSGGVFASVNDPDGHKLQILGTCN